ncbi:MAG: DNA polymerase III subunit alpha [Myxococcota bacterium]
MAEFAHLHLHTQYSILDGAIGVRPLMQRARASGMSAVAMTDHGNLFGAVQFQRAAAEAGVRSILGCETYLAQGSRFQKDRETGGFNGINHLLLLAMNEEGYRNLVQLVSRGFLEGFYYKPRIDMELLRAHSEGLIATSGCLSAQVPRAILRGEKREAWERLEEFRKIFGDRFYLELQRHGIPAQDEVNAELLRMHRDLGIPLVATNDAHYLEAADAHPHETLLCVQTGKTLDDPDRFQFTGKGFYVKDASEMLEVFHDLPEAVSNTLEVAERCRFELEMGRTQLPEFPLPPGSSPDSYLARTARRGLAERLCGDPDAPLDSEPRHRPYLERLSYELEVIRSCGFSGYFLIVWDFIRFARERGIPVGPGRGSGAGSLTAWALRIVEIDPVEYRIPFERFLNPERVSMPDFDIDFCMNRRSEVIRYVEQRYNGEGEEGRRVAGIVTFGTMQAKAALRDVARVKGLSFGEADRLAKCVPNVLGITLDEARRASKELQVLLARDTQAREVFELARSLEGQIRNPGKHPAGIVISQRPLLESVPLYRDSRTKEVVTQFDYRAAEAMGLVKFDFLGLRTLTIIDHAVRGIRARGDPDFDIEAAPLDDPDTYDMLCRGDTDGVFQLESSGMTDRVVKCRPRHFRDLIPLVALYRPGPLQSGMADDFAERRQGNKPVRYLLPELEEILGETCGVILYQDQVLQIANRLAGFSLGKGDLLRRAMGKKIASEMESQRKDFIEGCVQNGYPRKPVEALFDQIYEFAGYGFNKAHSAAYALLTHQTAYLKAHYPAEFVAAMMTAEWREHDKLDRYMRDAAARGIRVLPPCVNESDADFSVAQDGRAIRFGLGGCKNVGEGAVESILKARAEGGAFRGLYDFCERVEGGRVNRRVVESLVRCGAFDVFGATRASLWSAVGPALERGQRAERERTSGQGSLFAGDLASPEPVPEDRGEWPREQCLAGEKEILGFYVTGHPLQVHDDTLGRLCSVRPGEIHEGLRGQRVRMGGLLQAIQTTKTRRGQLMARGILEDLSGVVPVVLFPAVWEQHAEVLRSAEPLLVEGTLQIETERPELMVDEVVRLEEAWGWRTRELCIRVPAKRATRERLERLRALLDPAPGEIPIRIELGLGTVEAVLSLAQHRVRVTAELVSEIEGLFGPASVECRAAL